MPNQNLASPKHSLFFKDTWYNYPVSMFLSGQATTLFIYFTSVLAGTE